MLTARAAAARVTLVFGLAACAGPVGSAAAATQPEFPVMNTSETQPDGVYFRTAADAQKTAGTTDVGVYVNEHVRAKCFWHGTEVGKYKNDVWYYAYDKERPTAAGRSNEGWINTHYVDDGMRADTPHPSVPQCQSGTGDGGTPAGGSTAKVPAPAAVYFDPYEISSGNRFHLKDSATKEVTTARWGAKCATASKAYTGTNGLLESGQAVRTLAGWSFGRVGVVQYLAEVAKRDPAALKQINYVLMIDPGTNDELTCDRDLQAGSVLATWLQANPKAHLAVLSTSAVTQQDSSKGIQESYFNAIRDVSKQGTDLRSRVLTCNYDISTRYSASRSPVTKAHQRVMLAGQYWIQHEIGTGTKSCPQLSESGDKFNATFGWHP